MITIGVGEWTTWVGCLPISVLRLRSPKVIDLALQNMAIHGRTDYFGLKAAERRPVGVQVRIGEMRCIRDRDAVEPEFRGYAFTHGKTLEQIHKVIVPFINAPIVRLLQQSKGNSSEIRIEDLTLRRVWKCYKSRCRVSLDTCGEVAAAIAKTVVTGIGKWWIDG